MRSISIIWIATALILVGSGCGKRGIQPSKAKRNHLRWQGYYEGKGILFDNGTDGAVTVSFPDHNQQFSIGAGRWVVLDSGPENVRFVVTDVAGNKLDDISFGYQSQHTYVYNPKARWDYAAGLQQYGAGAGSSIVRQPPPGMAFFAIPRLATAYIDEELPDSVRGIGGASALAVRHRNYEPDHDRLCRVETSPSGTTYRVSHVDSRNESEPTGFTVQRLSDPQMASVPLMIRNPQQDAVVVRCDDIEIGPVGPGSYTILFVPPGQWHLEAGGPGSEPPAKATITAEDQDQLSGVPRAWIIGQTPQDLRKEVHWNDDLLYF